MNNKDKQKALLELGSKSLEAMAEAHRSNLGFVLGAVICTIRVSYETQARAIINHTDPLESDNSYIVGPKIGKFGGVQTITIKGSK